MCEHRDWDETYRQGYTPWDSGMPCSELARILEEEIRETFSGLFDFIWIRDFRFDTTGDMPAPLGYSCLMRRK